MAFDDDKDYAMRCYSLWCDLRNLYPEMGKYIKAMCFADDIVFAPLQGADILAHETNKFMRGCMEGRSPRQMFLTLIQSPIPDRGIEYISEVWDDEELDRIIEHVADRSWITFDP